MVWYHIISRLWAKSTPTVIGVDSILSAHVPLAHFLINHIIVYLIYTPSIWLSSSQGTWLYSTDSEAWAHWA